MNRVSNIVVYYLIVGAISTQWNLSSNSLTGVLIGQTVTLFNKKYDLPINEYGIDYNFYIKECNKIIDAIEPREEQLSLF